MALDRRGFLTFVAGGAIGSALTPLPWKMIDDISIWTQNWPWIPRIPKGTIKTRPSIARLGSTNYGILINSAEHHPVTAQGNPDHILSQGGIDPLAASSVQLLYAPSRIRQPLQKNSQGKFEPVSWDKASRFLTAKLKETRGKENSLACISGDETSSVNEVLSSFLNQMNSDLYFFPPSDSGRQLQVWQDIMRGRGQIGYDLENADFVLTCGADLLESWGTVVRNQKIFGRQKTHFIYVGPFQNNTAAVANQWLPMKAKDFGPLLMGLAYYILQEDRKLFGYNGLQSFKETVMSDFQPEKVAERIGIPKEKISNLAYKILKASRPLIVTGSEAGSGANTFPFYAGLCLNILLNRINRKGGIKCIPNPPKVLNKSTQPLEIQKRDLCGFLQEIDQGKRNIPEILFVYEANPIYSLPEQNTTRKTLKKIPLKVSFSQFMDETSAMSDLILPAPYFLERTDDSFTPFGSGQANYSLAQPVTKKLTDSRSTPDLIIQLAKNLGLDLGTESFKSLLKTKTRLLGANWSDLVNGYAWTDNSVYHQYSLLRIWNEQIKQIVDSNKSSFDKAYPLQVCAGNSLKTGSKTIAIPPFCLKTLSENELENDMFYVIINSQTAKKYKVKANEIIQLISPKGKCRAKVNIEETIVPDVVFVPQGFGHTNWDEFSRDKGENVMKILTVSREKGSLVTMWSNSKVKIAKI